MILEMNNVTKKFGNFTALDNVNLSLKQGEILGFIGPNRAGKTTSLRILLGILKASSGEAKVFGKDAWKDAVDIHKNIAYVPGDVNLWPNLTGGEVIDLFLRLRKGKEKRYQKELLERFDLDPSKKCRTYSKGNRQKVALVAAFASDADLFLLDEPTSGLDPLMESVFQEVVEDVIGDGKSILLSSHILSEVEKLCDRVSIIRQGSIIETGTLSELRHLTRTDVKVETKLPITGLQQFTELHNLQTDGNKLSFSIDGAHLGEIIAHISQFHVSSLECMPPTLEELFMSHYAERS